MLEAIVVENHKQHAGIRVTESFNAGIIIIGMEAVVAPNIDVVRKGILIRYVAKLGSKSNGVSTRNNLNQNLTLPITTTGVVGIPQMVFTNVIMITHENKIVN
jgi:hypothetical protein